MLLLLILADDFTGALDTGVQFAACGIPTRVVVGEQVDFAANDAAVLVVDTETRHLSAAEAYAVIAKLTREAMSAGVFSIYKKMVTKNKRFEEILDLLAIRIITDSVVHCYEILGYIHAKYRPIPGRFKDYIAMPKENMYQSLHTSVFGVDGHIFEIQLRTKEMDEIAEHGIASHWSYKEHSDGAVKNLMEQKLEIFRNTIDLATSDASNELFEQNMEMELLSKQVYVFTPKGDVMELPLGSTPVDFAYRIHSDIGDHMVGAIVNDNIVPLDYELNDNDIIKVNTNANAKPNIDWLKFVKTSQAKNKIKAYFSKQDRERYIEEGKSLIEKELRKQKKFFNLLIVHI